ncbi:MAG: phosphoribosylformylglycinamidine synthase [Robiginitomaculum sp.]|nr:MAG: phosphoribosylformylglycinamidine synthase [Robiginitomaculum sp.]
MASPEDMAKTMIANLAANTGKALPEWLKTTKASGLEKHGQILKMLKTDHGMTHGYANMIAAKTLETGEDVDLVAVQYSGAKASLKPVYDALITYIKTFEGIEIAPKKASVSLRRAKQFALITPATKTRIDLGLALKGEDITDRLEKYNAMCSHRVRLETVEDIDMDVKNWLKLAYERAG